MARRILLGLFVCLSLQGQTDPRLWRYLHPDAKAVIGVDWGRFQQSVVWTMMHDKLGALPVPMLAFPFLKDIDRIVLSTPGSAEGQPDVKAGAPILIAVRGHFAPDAVRKALADQGAQRQIYGKFAIYRPVGKGGSQDLAFVLPDPQTVLIGDLASLCAALDRNEFSPATPGPTLARAAVLDATNDFWAVISSPGVLANDRLQGFLAGDDLSDFGGALEFGMAFRDGFALNVTLKTASEAMAKHISDQIAKVIKLSAKDKPTNPGLADMEKKVKVAPSGDTVSISLRLTRDEVEHSTRLYMASAPNAHTAPASIQSSVQNPPPSVPAPLNRVSIAPETHTEPPKMVIKIEGLDGGTREVPYKQP
jgi:hypothetical protein